MRVLHVIHDFLPKHQAGSEIYAATLCDALARRGVDVDVLCADYDLALRHGTVRWRHFGELRVAELINNWAFSSFEETYDSPVLNRQLRNVLEAIRPDVLHIHNLLNLSFELPAIARRMGIPSVATLHEYTLLCPSGGQRVHEAERHICAVIDPDRCARCFPQHNFHARLVFGQLAVRRGAARRPAARAADVLRRRAPTLFAAMTRALQAIPASAGEMSPDAITRRLEQVRRVYDNVDLFLAPSRHLGDEFRRLGLPAEKLCVSDYGFVPMRGLRKNPPTGKLRIGFVGTLVWHKGAHVLLEAARRIPPEAFDLRIYGDPTTFPDYAARLQESARGLPVRFMGRFERSNVAEVYADLDVLVVSSLWPENSPLVIHEAFQAGIPVVGSNQGGTQNLVTHGRDGLLYDAFSPSSLAAALTSLIEDPERLRQMSRAVPAVKSLDEDARDLSGIYQELVAARHGAHTAMPAERSTAPETPARKTVAVFLNYRTPEDTVLAVRSLQASRPPVSDIVVVDNASSDGSVEELRRRLPGVTLIVADTNAGFSAGCNVGIREAQRLGAARVLLLNSDVIVQPDAVGALERALDSSPELGIVGPMLVSRADPELVASLGISYSRTTGRMRHHGFGARRTEAAGSPLQHVDGVSGCAMLIRIDVLDRIGLLAEEYFFGFEDLDFCLRARAAGYGVACVPGAVVLHEGSASIGLASSHRIYFTTRNHLLLARRFSPPAAWPVRCARAMTVVGLNLAHVLLTSPVPRQSGIVGLLRGVRDHAARRYGPAPEPGLPTGARNAALETGTPQ